MSHFTSSCCIVGVMSNPMPQFTTLLCRHMNQLDHLSLLNWLDSTERSHMANHSAVFRVTLNMDPSKNCDFLLVCIAFVLCTLLMIGCLSKEACCFFSNYLWWVACVNNNNTTKELGALCRCWQEKNYHSTELTSARQHSIYQCFKCKLLIQLHYILKQTHLSSLSESQKVQLTFPNDISESFCPKTPKTVKYSNGSISGSEQSMISFGWRHTVKKY